MGDQWQPIRVYSYLGDPKPGFGVTRQRVVDYLNGADPDSVEQAGHSYVEAAKLIRGRDGIQGALMKAAEELSEVWRGEGATEALKALRLLHASAGALGDAMDSTGEPMTRYAEAIRRYRSSVPAPSGGAKNTDGGGTTPPVIGQDTGSWGTGGTAAVLADDAARGHLERLNNEIAVLNSQIADGLAFKLPDIQPLDVDTVRADRLDPGSGTNTPTGTTAYWNGEGSSGGDGSGQAGTAAGAGGTGSGGAARSGGGSGAPNSPGGPQDPSQDSPQDQGPGQGQGQDGDAGQGQGQDGNAGPGGQNPAQPGADAAPQGPGDQQDVPPIIGDTSTQLADAAPPTAQPQTTTPQTATTLTPQPTSQPTTHPTTGNVYATPNVHTPPGQFSTTPSPYTPNSGTWYGSGGAATAAGPAVLRGGAPTPGGGVMAYPPGMSAAHDEGQEHTREIYDPEGDFWSTPQSTSPHRIG